MLFKLFLCFTLIPMIELFILIQMGTVIGSINTLLLVIASGFFGAWLARMEGIQTMLKVRTSLQQGIMPAEDLMDALIIYAAGVVLITPGLLTDMTGLLLLWSPTRNRFKNFLRQKFNEMKTQGSINITGYH